MVAHADVRGLPWVHLLLSGLFQLCGDEVFVGLLQGRGIVEQAHGVLGAGSQRIRRGRGWRD